MEPPWAKAEMVAAQRKTSKAAVALGAIGNGFGRFTVPSRQISLHILNPGEREKVA